MSLATLETQIRDNIAANAGTLILEGIQEPAVVDILEIVAAALSLRDLDIVVVSNSLMITGILDLAGISDIQVNLQFEVVDQVGVETCSLHFKAVSGDLVEALGGQVLNALKSDASVPLLRFSDVIFTCKPATKEISLEIKSTDPWAPAGDSLNIAVSDVHIKISRSGEEVAGAATLKEMRYSGELSGTLHVGQTSMAISTTFPDPVLKIDIKNLDFTTLFYDLGLTDVSDFLESFTPVDIPAFDIHLDYAFATKVFAMDFSTASEWEILESPAIFLKPSIHVKRDIPTTGKDPIISTRLTGTVKIGKMVVDVSATFPSPEFSVDVRDLDFASLTSDLGLTEVSDFLNSLSPASASPAFDIHFYYVPNTKAFLFKMMTSDDWMLSEQPAISLNPVITMTREPVEGVATPAPISTTLYGSLKMGMISAEVTATFPKPTINVEIQDLGITSLISSLGLPEVSNFINSASPISIPLFDIDLEYVPSTGAYTLRVTTDGEWRLVEGLDLFIIPVITVQRRERTTVVPTPQPTLTLDGNIKIGSTNIEFSVVPKDADQFLTAESTLDFQAITRDLGIAPLQDLVDDFSPPSGLEVDLYILYNLRTKEFTFRIESEAGFTVPYFEFSVSGIRIEVKQKLNELNQKVYSVDMQGTFNIGDLPISIGCKFPGEFELTASVPVSVNLSTFMEDCLQVFNVPVPPGLSEIGILQLTKVELMVAPKKPLFSAVISTKSGAVEFVIKKNPDTGKWMVILALCTDINNALSSVSAPLLPAQISDAISSPVLVLSNEDVEISTDLSLQPLQTMKLTSDIVKGINFQAMFDDGWITDLLNVDSLSIAGSIGITPFTLELLAKSTMDVNIGDVLFLKGFLFGIRYAAEDFEVKVGANIDLRIGEEILALAGAISLELDPAPSLTLSAYMREKWVDPFGLKGITLDDLGVNVGVSVPFIPEFCLMAGVTIGSFTGSAAVCLSGPALQLLNIEFNELNIGAVVRSLLSVVADVIPEAFFTFLDGIAMEDVKFHYALLDTTIGRISYKAGFHMKATLNLFDFRIAAEALLNLDDGIFIHAALDPINITVDGFEIIKLTHASDPSRGALLDLDLRRSSTNLQLVASGAISILGGLMSGLVDINVDGHGFHFLAICSIFDLFEASLEVTGPSLDNLLKGSGDGIYLHAEMQNDLLAYVRENILNFIKDVTESAVSGLNSAQNALIAAQNEVENWDTQIVEMKELVQREQDAVVTNLIAAQNAVTEAQNGVNKIDAQIGSIQSRINTLNKEIQWWYNWYNVAPWWEKTWRWTQLAFEVGWRSAEITAHYAEIGVLHVARAAAWAVLEIAKTALKIAEAIVVIADPSLDPRVIAIVAARAAAWAILKAAEGAVVVARAVVSGFSSLTQFVVDWGLGGVFSITSASFEAEFSNVKGRVVTLSADIVFMGISTNVTFPFNFDDPLSSVKDFALAIMTNTGIEVPL